MDKLLRKLPLFKGKQRLARWLLKREIREKLNFSFSGKYNITYQVPNIVENIGFELFINGVYEQETIQFISDRLSRGGTFLDVGANIGAILVPVKKLRPDISAIGVEAAPWLYDYLRTNVEQNSLNDVMLINKAVAAEPGKEMMFFSPSDKFGKGSLAPVFTSEGVLVRTTSLDEIHNQHNENRIDLIKMDVEGFEYHALKGGATWLKSVQAPDILFEFVDWAEHAAGLSVGSAQNLLRQYGYSIYRVQGVSLVFQPNTLEKGSCMFIATKSKRSSTS